MCGAGRGGRTAQEPDLTHLPAVVCAPWCTDGTGHIHEWHAGDQTCGDGQPYVSIDKNGMAGGFTMTVDEAEQLGRALLDRVAKGRQ